jgi:hypothetical protein
MTRVTAPFAANILAPLAMQHVQMLRSMIVCGCAFALILAGAATPF